MVAGHPDPLYDQEKFPRLAEPHSLEATREIPVSLKKQIRMKHPAPTPAAREAKREDFPDGSALVTYADGGILIVETDLAREAVNGSYD